MVYWSEKWYIRLLDFDGVLLCDDVLRLVRAGGHRRLPGPGTQHLHLRGQGLDLALQLAQVGGPPLRGLAVDRLDARLRIALVGRRRTRRCRCGRGDHQDPHQP